MWWFPASMPPFSSWILFCTSFLSVSVSKALESTNNFLIPVRKVVTAVNTLPMLSRTVRTSGLSSALRSSHKVCALWVLLLQRCLHTLHNSDLLLEVQVRLVFDFGNTWSTTGSTQGFAQALGLACPYGGPSSSQRYCDQCLLSSFFMYQNLLSSGSLGGGSCSRSNPGAWGQCQRIGNNPEEDPWPLPLGSCHRTGLPQSHWESKSHWHTCSPFSPHGQWSLDPWTLPGRSQPRPSSWFLLLLCTGQWGSFSFLGRCHCRPDKASKCQSHKGISCIRDREEMVHLLCRSWIIKKIGSWFISAPVWEWMVS